MISKDTLIEMGFVVGNGWDHEVFYHDSDFWVHFNGAFNGLDGQQICGNATMKEFFDMFIEHIRQTTRDSAYVLHSS